MTTAYHPLTNGLTERLNRTLTNVLAMYVSNNHQNWGAALPFVTFAYNTSRHETAGYSPFFLLYGRNPTLPMDTLVPSSGCPPTEYAQETIARADHARQVARTRFSESQIHQQSRYNSHHRTTHFVPGSLVLLWSPARRVGLSEKLLFQYTGPYRVCRQVTDVTYEIAPLLPSSSSAPLRKDIVHVVRLKPYRAPDTP